MAQSKGIHTALHVTPQHVTWLGAEIKDQRVLVREGHKAVLQSTVLPPAQLEVQAILKRRARWSVALPLPHRACLSELPPLGPDEFESGAVWETRKLLRPTEAGAVLGYESLSEPGGAQQTLLLAVRQDVIEPWIDWLREVLPTSQRMEPTLTAFVRSCCWVSGESDHHRGANAFVYADAGGSLIVIVNDTKVLGVRAVPSRLDVRTPENRWIGEEGIRLLRETLLYVEDRYPQLALQGLVGAGKIDRDWLKEAASATQLTLLPPVPVPLGITEELVDEESWLIPFGVLLGEAQS